jgi:hypothetical protein
MLIHYWVAIRASQENWPKISVDFYPSTGLTGLAAALAKSR